jgi:tetratricopeptide (TPR) repeat protein
MASIIPGYEYDIFISYRQKDNKYDGWVTEFVDHLKREIEATFKEDVSIYFDENPHDGLLEIHNVDKSLENKLKSLVFIPIISQTYVDPNSFAWQNEFVAYNKMAGLDQLGRDIKLASGNVCSRIIPIKIHELDASDTELIENEIGCRLRSIEFIFSSAGVNRPLKPDDNPEKNLNKSYYRDQINKVANAVKDVIYGMHPDPKKRAAKSYQSGATPGFIETQPITVPKEPVRRSSLSWKAILFGLLGILLVAALIIFLPKLINKAGSGISRTELVMKAIAVLPVSNLTGNPELEYIAQGLQDDITGRLGGINNLIVRPMSSTLQFKDSKEPIKQIAKKLSVDNIIESSIKGIEDSVQIEIRLVEAFPDERYLWSSSFLNKGGKNITKIYQDIVSHITEGLKIKLTQNDENNILNIKPHNPDLKKACDKGKYYMNRLTTEDFEQGLKYYNEAMAIDPTDPLPYLGLALGYSNAGHVSNVAADASNRAVAYARQALALDSTLAEAYIVLAYRALYTDYDFVATKRYLKRAMELNNNLPMVHYHYGWYLMLSNNVDGAVAEFRKSIEIAPTDVTYTCNLGSLYWWIGRYQEAFEESQKALQLDPNYPMAYAMLGAAYAGLGMYEKAIETHKKGLAISPGFESVLGVAYAMAGQRDKALEIASQLEKTNEKWYVWGIAEIYATLGDKEKALYWVEESYKRHHDFTPWFKYDASLKSLYDEPRFKDVINHLNLPEN